MTFFHADFRKEFPSQNLWRVRPELPLSKLCAVPLALQDETLFEWRKGRKAPRRRKEEGWPAKGAKRKKGRLKTGHYPERA